jgi:glutathione synthase/RimK-type ligase-like ATP-grasp enzyme
MTYLLRRRRLGKTSCEAIAQKSTTGIQVWLNTKPTPHDVTQVIRWGCTSLVPEGRTVYNHSAAIQAVSNKAVFRESIQTPEFPVWRNLTGLVYPAIMRPLTHHQGRHTYLVQDLDQARDIERQLGAGRWYGAPYINKVAEFRVFVVQGRVAAVAQKTPANPTAVAWNVAQGGRFDNVRWNDWPLPVIQRALQDFAISTLHFGGVDVMVDANGRAFTLEINSAPSLTSDYRQACMAKCFDFMVSGNEAPEPTRYRRWQDVIHPALRKKAT